MKKTKRFHSKFVKYMAILFALVLLSVSSSLARGLSMEGSPATTSNPLGQSPVGMGVMNMRLPLFLGGSFGLGAGAGVGDGTEVGVSEIKPMLGAWLPGYGFIRLGYGFSSYNEKDDDGNKSEIENSNFSVDAGAHLFSEFYVVSSYSRANALSENGDVSWNEWSLGFGTFWPVFSKSFLMFEIGYHWVREHFDPFLEKTVSGGRIQMNLGFIVFVY